MTALLNGPIMHQAQSEARHDHISTDRFHCAICGFTLDPSNGGYLYVKNSKGRRIPLKGREQEAIAHILLDEEFPYRDNSGNLGKEMDLVEERVGYMSACLCMNCLDQFGLDLRKDTIECPGCKSDHVKTFLEITSKPCPKCQSKTVQGSTINVQR
jgi:hypothetical protein